MALQRRNPYYMGDTESAMPGEPGGIATPRGYTPYEVPPVTPSAGLPGGTAGPDQPTPPPTYRIQPVDAGKMASKHDAKYDFLRTAQGFDPTKGITSELVDRINALGYGTFSGSGQHGSWSNITDAGRAAGLDPHDFSGDFIQNYGEGKNPDAQWAWDWYDPNPQGGSGGFATLPTSLGNFAASGGSSFQRSAPSFDDLHSALSGLFPGGAFNKDLVTRRTSNAADALARQRKSSLATNQARLAERGLIGSGPEGSAAESLDQRLYNDYSNQVNDIYANESAAADQRMVQALQIAAGLSANEAQTAVDAFRANSERDIGFGNLALGNKRADQDFSLGQGNLALNNATAANTYNLGLGRLGLDRDAQMWTQQNMGLDQLIALIDQLYRGAGTSAGGHV